MELNMITEAESSSSPPPPPPHNTNYLTPTPSGAIWPRANPGTRQYEEVNMERIARIFREMDIEGARRGMEAAEREALKKSEEASELGWRLREMELEEARWATKDAEDEAKEASEREGRKMTGTREYGPGEAGGFILDEAAFVQWEEDVAGRQPHELIARDIEKCNAIRGKAFAEWETQERIEEAADLERVIRQMEKAEEARRQRASAGRAVKATERERQEESR